MFRDRLDVWLTPADECEAHTNRDKASRINAAIRAYVQTTRSRAGNKTGPSQPSPKNQTTGVAR